jgi:hypothetical protein
VNKPRQRTKTRTIVSRETLQQLPAAQARNPCCVILAQAGTQFVKPLGVALLGSRLRGNDIGMMTCRRNFLSASAPQNQPFRAPAAAIHAAKLHSMFDQKNPVPAAPAFLLRLADFELYHNGKTGAPI